MPKTHWPDGDNRSICGLVYPDVQLQFSLDASSVTCERCKKLLPEPTRTIWDRISDEDYQPPPPRPRRRRPKQEPVEPKEEDYEPPRRVLTPEEQDRQREEVLAMDFTHPRNFIDPTDNGVPVQRQLRQEQAEEETRLEQGRRVTRQLIAEFQRVYRRDQQAAMIAIFLAFIGLLFAVDIIGEILKGIFFLIQGLYHLVHTWLTAHK